MGQQNRRISLGCKTCQRNVIQRSYDYINREEVEGYAKMAAINDLHIGASYNVFKGVSVYAQVHNLLNKKYQYYLGYPAEGFNFLGGLSFRF